MFYLQIGLNILWALTASGNNFYDDVYSRNFGFLLFQLFKNTAYQIIASIIFIFLTKEDLFTRNFIIFFATSFILFVIIRVIIFRKTLKLLRSKGKNIRSLVIIGSGEMAVKFKNLVLSNPDFGYAFKGFVHPGKNVANENDVLSGIDNLEKTLVKNRIEEAVIALPSEERFRLDDIIKICNKLAVKSHIIPDYLNYISSRFQISSFGSFPIITVRREPLDEIHWRLIKRLFDIVFAIFVLVFILSWLVPIVFIAIKINSKGPVLFIQERIGAKNFKFNCYKFRTLNVEEGNDVQKFKPVIQNDSRITNVGKFLRKTNIDEMPQFINVLFGDMSVVGPRPHALPYDSKYGTIVDEIRLRHSVKPGITGWAQVHGLRGDVENEEENKKRTKKRIEYDLWYIENWSFSLDFQIIGLTIWRMIKGESKGT